jgi:hypothetical protein
VPRRFEQELPRRRLRLTLKAKADPSAASWGKKEWFRVWRLAMTASQKIRDGMRL